MGVLNAAAASALLAFFAIATPVAQNAGRTKGSNRCDDTTWANGADLKIPQAPVDDCKNLIDNIDPYSTYSVGKSWSRPYTVGDCAFNVRVIAGAKDGLVGGADAIDLLEDSAAKYAQGSGYSAKGEYSQVVSAEGQVNCDVDSYGSRNGDQVKVQWIVSSSSYNPANDEETEDTKKVSGHGTYSGSTQGSGGHGSGEGKYGSNQGTEGDSTQGSTQGSGQGPY